MTLEDIKTAELVSIEARNAELSQVSLTEATTEELRAYAEETTALKARMDELRAAAKEAAETRAAVAAGKIEAREITHFQEKKTMKTIEEFRNSTQYIDAYVDYIKAGAKDDTELRALLTENVGEGTIAVPDLVLGIVQTAWEQNNIMNLVKKVNVKGNLKIQFEIEGTDAVVHVEGTDGPTEEVLTHGIVKIIPAFVKKWISLSDEVLSMRGTEFLEYVYSEVAYKIVKKMASILINQIKALPETPTADSVSAAKISEAPIMGTIAEALGHLCSDAANPTIVMNRLTYATFKKAQYAANYAADIFENVKYEFTEDLPAYNAANAGAVYAIVGDFGRGALANFPNGDTVKIITDELTQAEDDLVKITGKEYVGIGCVADRCFALITKPAG